MGLVRHWLRERPQGWLSRAALNGTGAAMSAMAGIGFFASKFTEGAWMLLFIIPALMALFWRIEGYYRAAGTQLGCVDLDHSKTRARCEEWKCWNPGLPLRVLPSPHRNLVPPVIGYVRSQVATGREGTVLLAEVQPRKRRHEMLHNQRSLVLGAALRSRTDAVVATVASRLH